MWKWSRVGTSSNTITHWLLVYCWAVLHDHSYTQQVHSVQYIYEHFPTQNKQLQLTKNWSVFPKDCSTDWKGAHNATFYSGMKHNWFPDVTSEDRNRKMPFRFVLFSSAYCMNVKWILLAEKELNSRIFSCFFAECLIWNWRRNMFQNVTDTKQATMISWEIPTMYKSWHSLQICVTFGEMLNMAITREFGTLAGSGLW